MKAARLCALLVTTAILVTSCRFSTEWGLVEYLEQKGNPGEGKYKLREVTAYEKISGQDENVLETGSLFYDDRILRLEAPTTTVVDVPVSGAQVYYTLQKYDRDKHVYYYKYTNVRTVANAAGLTVTDDIIKNGLEISNGQYMLTAWAELSGCEPSEQTSWLFQIGWDTLIGLTIVLEGNYRLGYDINTLTFSETSVDAGEFNTAVVTPLYYKITGTDSEGHEILVKQSLPDDLPDPLLSLIYQGDTVAIQSETGTKNADGDYEFVIPPNQLGEDVLYRTGSVQLRVQVTYKGYAYDSHFNLTIVK